MSSMIAQPAALPGAAAMGVLVPKPLMLHHDSHAWVEGMRESTARVFACADATNVVTLTALRSGGNHEPAFFWWCFDEKSRTSLF